MNYNKNNNNNNNCNSDVDFLSGKNEELLLSPTESCNSEKNNKFFNLTADCEHENSFQCSLYKTLTNKDLDHIIAILKTKYNSCNYYSDASKNTLIALNPCESKPSLYSESIMNLYREWSVSSFSSRFTNPFPPHIFKYAAVAWKILTSNQNKSNQTLLVSGESGSGKTKSINFIMSYFVYVSNTRNSKNIESILLSTNLILEAFGNASTKLNENSSRFGKYIQLFFSDSNLVSAHIVTYLLEKTRSLNEFNCRTICSNRNFHVFYECVLGANDLERNEWHLTQSLIDKYLNLNLIAPKYVAKLSLLKLSFSELDIFCFFNDTLKLVSAIAHLNCCSIFDGLTQFEKASIEHLELASKLLGFNIKDLENYMLVHELKINYGKKRDSYQHLTNSEASFKNENSNKTRKCLLLLLNGTTKSQENLKKITILKKHCNSNEIKQRLNCLIKLIYTEMFKWIVNKINVRLNGPNFDDYKLSFIGLLDIYGFENLENNCLEQLCINYANEKLHQCFIESHFKLTQQDYISESIEWKPISFDDNLSLLKLLEQNNDCIFNLINEESILKREIKLKNSNSGVLLTKINTTLKERNPKKTTRNSNFFVIKHYAGSVSYSTQNLIYKNNDQMPDDLPSFLLKSSNKFLKSEILRNFFRKHNNDDDNDALKTNFNKKKSFTVLSKFKRNLDNLLKELQASEINYIRCIKPNHQMRPNYFDEILVKKQLEACGIVSILNMSERGYSHKYFYGEFLTKYMSIFPLFKRKYLHLIDRMKLYKYLATYFKLKCQVLSESKTDNINYNAELKDLVNYFIETCIVIMKFKTREQFTLGTRRVFLKNDLVNVLDEINDCIQNDSVCLIKTRWRQYRNNKAAAKIQHWWLRIAENRRKLKLSSLRLVKSCHSLDESMSINSSCLYGSPTNSFTRFKPEKVDICYKLYF